MSLRFFHLLSLAAICGLALAQDPTGTLEGRITDPSAARVPGAEITVVNSQTGLSARLISNNDGSFDFSYLPVGQYHLIVRAKGFANYQADSIRIDVNRIVSVPVDLVIASAGEQVSVKADSEVVDHSSTLGNVVSSQQATDLPLNGRNLTQLGLLQPGVAPMTAGLSQAGGIARRGQAFAVNGQRPESNNYLLDGASNVDSVNGGYALRTPVDAVSEFRILTL